MTIMVSLYTLIWEDFPSFSLSLKDCDQWWAGSNIIETTQKTLPKSANGILVANEPMFGPSVAPTSTFLGHEETFCCRPLNKHIYSLYRKKKMGNWQECQQPKSTTFLLEKPFFAAKFQPRFVPIQVKISKKDGRRDLKISSLKNDWTFVRTSTILLG